MNKIDGIPINISSDCSWISGSAQRNLSGRSFSGWISCLEIVILLSSFSRPWSWPDAQWPWAIRSQFRRLQPGDPCKYVSSCARISLWPILSSGSLASDSCACSSPLPWVCITSWSLWGSCGCPRNRDRQPRLACWCRQFCYRAICLGRPGASVGIFPVRWSWQPLTPCPLPPTDRI